MFSLKELKLMRSKIDDSIEEIRLNLCKHLKDSPADDLLSCVHIGDDFFTASYFSSSLSDREVLVKITPYDIIGDDSLILVEKDYCRYLQNYIIEKTKEYYGF